MLPDSIASIGSALFYNGTALETAVLPGGITELKADSESHGFFDKCSSLKSVNNTSNLITIGEHAFSECSALSSFDFPSTLTTIGKHAFFKCEKLETIDLPDSVTAIDDGAFGSCFSLKSVKLSKNLKTISSGAFGICTSLTSIEIPSNVTAIAASFVSCSSLAEIYVDNLEGSIEGSPWGADTAKELCII